MKRLISVFLFFLLISSNSFPVQKKIIEEADLYLDMMEYKAAIENYSKALASGLHQSDIRKDLAFAYFQSGNIDDALKFLKVEIKLFPDNWDAYDLLGNIYFKKEDFGKSISAYKKVIEIDPEDAIGHYNLGCVYSALKDWKNAEVEWTKAIEYERESRKREERGEVSDDELRYTLIVIKRPVSFKAHKSLGRLYLEQNLVDRALEEFLKAVDLEPNDPDSYLELGKIYHQKSEINRKYVEKAILYYERYLYLGGKEEAEVKDSLKLLKKKDDKVL